MSRIFCPQCKGKMTATTLPIKHFTSGTQALITNYCVCKNCGAQAKSVSHTTILVKGILIQEKNNDLLSQSA